MLEHLHADHGAEATVFEGPPVSLRVEEVMLERLRPSGPRQLDALSGRRCLVLAPYAPALSGGHHVDAALEQQLREQPGIGAELEHGWLDPDLLEDFERRPEAARRARQVPSNLAFTAVELVSGGTFAPDVAVEKPESPNVVQRSGHGVTLALHMAADRTDGTGLVVVHDQVDVFGGTERVLDAILTRFPRARAVAPSFSGEGGSTPSFAQLDRTSVIRCRGRRRHFLGPLYARKIASESLGDVQVVLTVAHAGWSLAASVPPGARHVCYSAGLPRALYGHTHEYLRDYPWPSRPLLRAAVPALRRHHRRLASRPHRVIANSAFSARAVADRYGIEAEVLHPPVRTAFFTPDGEPGRRHVLAVSRLVPHKGLEAMIEAFRGLDDTLVIAGTGPWLERLRAPAPANVRFAGHVDDHALRALYRDATCFVSATVEEFGIAMAEAQACGVPVIAPRAGGALEIVQDGLTGILVERIDAETIAQAVRAAGARTFAADACRAAAVPFAEERFVDGLQRVIEAELLLAERAPSPIAAARTVRPGLPQEGAAQP